VHKDKFYFERRDYRKCKIEMPECHRSSDIILTFVAQTEKLSIIY